MAYRTKTYIAADWDTDQNAVKQLYNWKENNHLTLDFHDAHEITQARDTSNNCNIKRSLKERLDASKNFVLIVGDKTKTLRNGSCYYCQSYNSWTKNCAKGYPISYESYVEYECRMAIEEKLNILVLYNADSVDKSLCPELIKNYVSAHHVAMKTYNYYYGCYVYDYQVVKTAFDQYLS